MARALVLLRPEPGWSASAAAARGQGLQVAGEPLFVIEPVAWEVPAGADFDALLIGSANALRHAGAQLARLRALPVHAVGAATAQAAQAMGMTIAATGQGGLQAVLDTVPPGTRLLRLAGEAHVPLTLPPDVTMTTRIVYRSVPQPLAAGTIAALNSGAVAALHSAEAAGHFDRECARAGVARARVRIAALGPRIAVAAGAGWHSIHTASQPCEAALLALAKDLCQTP